MDYKELLKKAMEKIPKHSEKHERFNPPHVDSFVEGNKTIVKNLNVVANYLNRDLSHILKFLSKEFATYGNVEGNRVVFIGKFRNRIVNERMQQYIKEYVICKKCGSPDTKIEKEDRTMFLHCMACQARYPIRKVR